MSFEELRKAVQLLPKQHDGYYALDNCSHKGREESFQADDPHHGVTICVGCLYSIYEGDASE